MATNMTEALDRFVLYLKGRLTKKNSWGKNELAKLIDGTRIEVLNEIINELQEDSNENTIN